MRSAEGVCKVASTGRRCRDAVVAEQVGVECWHSKHRKQSQRAFDGNPLRVSRHRGRSSDGPLQLPFQNSLGVPATVRCEILDAVSLNRNLDDANPVTQKRTSFDDYAERLKNEESRGDGRSFESLIAEFVGAAFADDRICQLVPRLRSAD
jgi:hypothetical protein